MSAKNWQQVKDTFHEALRRESGERDRFLDKACDGDIDFRIEVESLLVSLNEAKNFLEQPVIGEPPRPKAGFQLKEGQAISHYRIISPIASGGMGEVYLAEDEQLRRSAAIKVLPARLLNSKERLSRFQREAQVVSALNHPNILTVFEFGAQDDIKFLASEFVRGETLRARLERSRLTVNESLDIATQMASALKAAHEAGVVHRDIKPENVMIREDGYVKVLDFGLAKLTEQPVSDSSPETQTFLSWPGVIMDEYMSASDLIVGKPGGLTTSEALAKGLVFVIANPIPGQEERNSDHLLEQGVAIRSNNPATLGHKVEKLLNDKERLETMRTNALRFARPNAAFDIADTLAGLGV